MTPKAMYFPQSTPFGTPKPQYCQQYAPFGVPKAMFYQQYAPLETLQPLFCQHFATSDIQKPCLVDDIMAVGLVNHIQVVSLPTINTNVAAIFTSLYQTPPNEKSFQLSYLPFGNHSFCCTGKTTGRSRKHHCSSS